MGLYFHYRLGVLKGKKVVLVREKQKIIQSLFDDPLIDPFKEMMNAITVDGQTAQESKWYNYSTHLTVFSEKHRDLSFILGLSEWSDKYKENECFFYSIEEKFNFMSLNFQLAI